MPPHVGVEDLAAAYQKLVDGWWIVHLGKPPMPYEQSANLYNPIPYAFFFSTRKVLFNGRYTMVGRSAGANVNFL
jgi:hypothetical protein